MSTVAKSAYCKRLWACFSVMLLINIGSCRSFFGLFFLDPLPIVLYVILFRSPVEEAFKGIVRVF